MSDKRDQARRAALEGGRTTRSQSLFGAAMIFFVVGLAAGIVAGMSSKVVRLDGSEEFGMVPFAVFTAGGLVAAAVCYAASVAVDTKR